VAAAEHVRFDKMPCTPERNNRLVTYSVTHLDVERRNLFTRSGVVIGIIACGLLADQKIDFWGQTLTNASVWALLLYWLRRANARTQLALTACVIYATAGEIFLSLVWGIYDYRLGTVPLFVPPGHALLFTLGGIVAARAPAWIVWCVPLAAAPFVGFLLLSGAGTLDALLYAMFLICLWFGRARKLYAVMFVLSLIMEVYGTALGTWSWSTAVPWVGLTTPNPPLAAGTFYCVLDMLVVTTVSRWHFTAPAARHPEMQAGFKRLFPAGRLAARFWARSARTAAGT
jgi:hypothetical protein